MSALKLDFIGVGAAKAATTWLAECLRIHPQVCLPKQKELNFFCSTYVWWPTTATYYDRGQVWLERQFQGCQRKQIQGEISPNYLVDPTSPALIWQHNPAIKLFFSLRNPVEGLYAMYFQLARNRRVPDTFEAFLEEYPHVLTYGSYFSHVGRYMQHFPRRQCHFLIYDDIVADPQAVLEGLFAFLAVGTQIKPLPASQEVNPGHLVRFRLIRDGIGDMTDLLNTSPGARRAKAWLRMLQAHRVADWLEARNLRPGPYPPLRQGTRRRLQDLYAAEIDQLGALLGRDLSHWHA
jgi:hypothetical protein